MNIDCQLVFEGVCVCVLTRPSFVVEAFSCKGRFGPLSPLINGHSSVIPFPI